MSLRLIVLSKQAHFAKRPFAHARTVHSASMLQPLALGVFRETR
jgi:hypothetical protein